MNELIGWLVAGLFIGVVCGFVAFALCSISGRDSREEEIRDLRRKLGEIQ